MRGAMDIATLGCSVNVKLSEDKKQIEDVRIAYGVAGPIPMRAVHAEQAGKGRQIEDSTIELIGDTVLEDVTPRDSWRASKAFPGTHLKGPVQTGPERVNPSGRRCLS